MTLKELAKKIGCSTATLDRVINGRSGVSPETKARVLSRINELSFEVNSAGKALAMQNKLKFGIILSADLVSSKNLFFSAIYEGMQVGVQALSKTGAKFYFKMLKSGSAHEQVEAILDLTDIGVASIALSIEEKSEELQRIMDEAMANGVEFISYFNSISTESLSLTNHYNFGGNHEEEGRYAAELLARFMGRKGKVVLLSGLMKNLVHQTRIDTAYEVLKKRYPDIEIIDIARNMYPEERILEYLDRMLKYHPDINGVIASCGYNYLVADTLYQKGLCSNVTQVMFDFTYRIEEQLHSGMIDAVVGQDLKKLGYNTIIALYDLLMDRHIDPYKINVPTSILLSSNK